MGRRRAWVLVGVLLAGCAVNVAAPKDAGRAPVSMRGTAKPAASPSATAPPRTAASPTAAAGVVAALASPSAAPLVAAVEPLVFPTKLLPPLPAYLVGPDGASLVGPDGASLVGPDGASLVGPDGASLVGPDGASYALAQAAAPTATPGAAAEDPCGPLPIPLEPGTQIKMTLDGYLRTVGMAEGLLAKAATLRLVPDVPQTAPMSFSRSVPPTAHTFLVERRGSGGMLRVAKGDRIAPEALVASLAFTSAETGDMLLRLTGAMVALPGPGMAIRVAFDRAARTSSGDYQTSIDMNALGLPLGLVNERARVDLVDLEATGPATPDVRLVLASSRSAPDGPCQDLYQKMAVNYLPDGRAAMQLGLARTFAGPLEFLGLDGVRAAAPGPGTGFFVDKDGIYLAGDVTMQELGPAMPTAADIPAQLPPLADPEDPFADPAFEHLR